MMYHSPFSVLKSLGIEANEITPDQIKKLEKRLLLELELSGKISLQAGESQLTKNDILNLFDEIGQDDNLGHHRKIAENEQLLLFLQTGDYDEQLPFYNGNLLYEKNIDSFRSFISPYLSEVMKKEINLQFNKRNFRKAFKLLELSDLLTDTYKTLAFDKLAGSINQLIRIIGQFSTEEIPLDKKNYAFLMHDHFITFINQLPAEFNNSREKLAINLNNLGAHYQKKELKFVYMIFMALRQLNCSESMKKTIIDNSNILSNNYRHSSQEESDKSTGYGCFSYIGIIVLLVVLIRACSSNGFKSDSSSYNNSNYFNSSKYKDLQKIIEKNSSIYSKRLDHIFFTSQIITYYSNQKTQQSDSVSSIPVPKNPYNNYCTSFDERIEAGDSVLISNQSDFDLIVFALSAKVKYAVGIPSKSSTKVILTDKDVVNLYIGKNWDETFTDFGKQRQSQTSQVFYNGIFSEKSPFTTSQLRQYHQYRSAAEQAREQFPDAIELEEVEIVPDIPVENPASGDSPSQKQSKKESESPGKKLPSIHLISGDFGDFSFVRFSEEFTPN